MASYDVSTLIALVGLLLSAVGVCLALSGNSMIAKIYELCLRSASPRPNE